MIKKYSEIAFQTIAGEFKHNLDADFECVVLWKAARPFRDAIRRMLSDKFEVLLETEVEWSDKYFHVNAQRLYEAPIYTNSTNEVSSTHAEKIGDNRFIVFVVKDTQPYYTYAQSVSGAIEMSNLNIVGVKYKIRDLIFDNVGVKYSVHSTNNIYEFFYQVPLLLGVSRFKKILAGEEISEALIVKDLEGAGGWTSYRELFEILNLTTNYLVQRGFETLPDSNPEMDIDFLTDNFQRLASAIGAKQKEQQLYKGVVVIENQEISLDFRYLGDKYYNDIWANKMLQNKVLVDDVYRPRPDDYFFSLLFHAKVQKPRVKEKYVGILKDLSQQLNFKWFKTEYLQDDVKIGALLNGYFRSQNYAYENPVDKGVYKNIEVINYLPVVKTEKVKKSLKIEAKIIAKKYLPKKIIAFGKRITNA